MRTFLIVVGTLCYVAAAGLFGLAQGERGSVIIELESFITFLTGTVALVGVGVIAAVTTMRDDMVRLNNIERIEAQQRALGQAAK